MNSYIVHYTLDGFKDGFSEKIRTDNLDPRGLRMTIMARIHAAGMKCEGDPFKVINITLVQPA